VARFVIALALAQPEHLGAAAVSALVAAGLCTAARLHPGPWRFVAARILGVLLIANLVVWQMATVREGTWHASGDLMVDLCPVVSVIGAIALWDPRPLLVELAYFWGIAGSIQGVLQPDTRYTFPSYWFFQFYGDHTGPVVAGLFLVIGLRLSPRRGAVTRVFLATMVFAVVAGVVDVLSNGNYMYLRSKGPAGTLLDLMGPWPWYMGTAAAVALVLFLALDAPFRLSRRRQRRQVTAGIVGASPA